MFSTMIRRTTIITIPLVCVVVGCEPPDDELLPSPVDVDAGGSVLGSYGSSVAVVGSLDVVISVLMVVSMLTVSVVLYTSSIAASNMSIGATNDKEKFERATGGALHRLVGIWYHAVSRWLTFKDVFSEPTAVDITAIGLLAYVADL
ncbi:hypothetical protein FHETE_6087 [Fusarium heterosporum]|uniref:Uncharacterized protein n=1 Tax=Fusarium heterosporum TaxID=42747 RepID=A0A8H5WQM5_FUSHE|nr:hypothetical protein FHETE_6087 [Fusarium heterosporum]